MDLLPYKDICQFHNTIPNEHKSLVVIYKEINKVTTIMHDFEPVLMKTLLAFLTSTHENYETGTLRVYPTRKEDNIDFVIIALVCVKEDSVEDTQKASAIGLQALKTLNVKNIIFSINYMPEQMAIGAYLSAYNYDLFTKKTKVRFSIASFTKNESFELGVLKASHQNFARFLSDTPANHMTPTHFVNYATDFLKDKNLKMEVHEREYLIKNNMNMFLSVTEGSDQPCKFVIIKYKGKPDTTSTDISLVGKGITFDSGGISIKPSKGMGDMKADMMGAATVLAAISLIAELKVNYNVTATLPLCENLPSGKASKPGDVRVSMSGISVEIDNTDAEGRLILGDAFTHALLDKPKYMVDVATLTGAIVVALGNVYMGMFCNDDKFSGLITDCGKDVYNEVWRMPLDKKYKKAMRSNVADIKNIGDGGAGSCTAAIFLNEFVDEKVKWAHLDVAGVMVKSFDKNLYGDGMSGKPTCLLYEIVSRLSLE